MAVARKTTQTETARTTETESRDGRLMHSMKPSVNLNPNPLAATNISRVSQKTSHGCLGVSAARKSSSVRLTFAEKCILMAWYIVAGIIGVAMLIRVLDRNLII